jgi:hypothetical protein
MSYRHGLYLPWLLGCYKNKEKQCDLFYAAQLTKPNTPVVNVIKLLKVKKSVTSGANVKKLFTVVTNEFS